ncbi:MAG: putative glutathione S-transferase [uncultured archaeon A07HN63]|nr:MAG: putative glutathione S-transferase [uncultured archaeon A07HN63]
MNMLVDGEWRTDTFQTTNDDGAFERQTTPFRNWIAGSDVPAHVDAEPDERFEAEAGRYHLYVSYACPWAHRTLLVRALMGLEDAIGVSVVDPYRGDDGWQFTPEKAGCTPDKLHDSDYLRELYAAADPDATCRVTVPVLWDTKEETIVNNESREIIRMLTTGFREIAERDIDLAPESNREEIDEIITDIYEPINNGVYKAGFATEQEPYDAAVTELFDALDHWNEVLADQRFLAGDQLTEADICMFTTLIRFDHVYHTHFMCNVQYIHQYDNLWPYLRDVYQQPGVAETVDIDHIKEHYYTTHPDVTPHGIIAEGPELAFDAPHDRDELTTVARSAQ